MPVRLMEIAEFLGAKVEGDSSLEIAGVAALDSAGPGALSFLANPKYAAQVKGSKASALILGPKDLGLRGGKTALVSDNPHRDFAKVCARWFYRPALPAEGVHPTALVGPGAKLGKGCRVGACVVIEAGASLGEGTSVFPFCYVGAGSRLGRDCLVYPGVTILAGCAVGDRVILHSGVVLGADGFGFAPDFPQGYVKVPQMGAVEIGDDVEIQANSCVDRGALGPTRVGQGTKVDNLVQIAHNVQIGRNSVLCAQAGVSGSTHIGDWVTLAGQVGVTGHIEIGDGAIVTAQAGVGKDVPAKGMVSGTPARPTAENHRGLAEITRLTQLRRRVAELEKKIARMEKGA